MKSHVSENSMPALGFLVFTLLLAGCVDTASENQAPVFTSLPGELRVKVGDSVDLIVTAEDPEGESVTLGMDTRPPGAEFIAPAGIGRFHWAPIVSDSGRAHDAVFSAIDAKGARSTVRVQVVVETTFGEPRFVSPPQRVLDLGQTDTLIAEVKVKDDDSGQVTLSLEEDAPKGMVLTRLTDKSAELRWTPNPEQIAAQSVYGARVSADDGTSGRATQTLSIIIIAKRDCAQDNEGECGCQPPTITHREMSDQRDLEDYDVTAAIVDGESAIAAATLFFTTGDPSDLNSYTSVAMQSEGDQFRATIPNPLLSDGQSQAFSYFICALDDDDPNGETCDNLTCVPEEGKFGFTAFAPGDQDTCREDEFEPNEDALSAIPMGGNDIVTNLTICPGDVDTFQVEVPPNSVLEVYLAYTAQNGNLGLGLLDIDGTIPILLQDTPGDDEFIAVESLSAGIYFLEVSGEENSYDLLTNVRAVEDVNCTDAFEPNESALSSSVITPDRYSDLKICGGDVDVFAVAVSPGDVLEATAFFSHLEGDLDMALLDVDQTVLSRSVSITDNETVSFNRFTRGGNVFLRIQGFEDEVNSYDLEVEVTAADDSCAPDDAEPNDNPNQAARIVDGESRSLSICPNEQDFFSIALDRAERVEATIEFVHADADLDMALFAPDGEDSLVTAAGVDNSETIRWTALEGGNHFINAFGFEGDSGPYTLSVRTCNNDSDDPNDTSDQATGIASGTREQKLCLAETDWYALNLEAGQVALIEVQPDVLTGVEAHLFAANGTDLIAPFDTDVDRFQVLHEAPQSGTVLLRVLSTNTDALVTNYSLSVEID